MSSPEPGREREVSDLTQQLVARRLNRRAFVKRAAALGVSASAIGSILAACARDTEPTEAVEGIEEIETLRTAWSATPERLNQQTTFSPAATDAIINLNEPLVRWKLRSAAEVENGWEIPWEATAPNFEEVMEGRLCESWEADDEYLHHTFRLRPGIVSHAGNELTSEDVRYTLVDQDFGHEAIGFFFHQAGSQTDPDKIRVIDPLTIEVELDEPNPLFLMGLNQMYRQIYDSTLIKEHVTEDDPLGAEYVDVNDVGFGPYTLANYQVDVEWVYEAFEDYQLEPKPKVKTIIQRAVPDEAQRLALLQRGSVDVAFGLLPEQLRAVEDAEATAVDNFKGVLILSLNLNPNERPLGDPRVRQALAWAVPYSDIVSEVFRGFGRPATLCPDVFAGVAPYPYSFDIERAQALLSEAGHENGFEMEVVYDSADPLAEPLGIQLQTAYNRIGVKVNLRAAPTSVYYEGLGDQRFPAGIYRNAPHTPDNHWCTFLNYHSESANNWFAYSNPEIDQQIEQASRITEDYGRRVETYERIQGALLDDVPVIPLAMPGYPIAKQANVSGLTDYTEQVLWAHVGGEQG